MKEHLTTLERFEASYTKAENDCWIWNKATDKDGYGLFKMDGKSVRATRYSYQLYKGLLRDGYFACHTCDNPSCVNPNHLFLGTAKDNAADMVKKGRSLFGNRNPSRLHTAKITLKQVDEIRDLCAKGLSQAEIGKAYGISQQQVSRIFNNQRWKAAV